MIGVAYIPLYHDKTHFSIIPSVFALQIRV